MVREPRKDVDVAKPRMELLGLIELHFQSVTPLDMH